MRATTATSQKTIQRDWHLIDLQGKILGRVASEIATLLMGKSKPYFVRNLDCGDFVVAINAKQVVITGRKAQQKTYFRYSGYPGGLRKTTYDDVMQKSPVEILEHAVKGMLPQNRLRDRMLKRFFVFSETTHTYGDKFKVQDAKDVSKKA